MKKLSLLLLLLGLSLPAWSGTIIDGGLGDAGLGISYQQSVAVSWTMSSGYSNVSIAVPLYAGLRELSQTGVAYLASSAAGSSIVAKQFDFPVIPFGGKFEPQFVGLFDNLTLTSGTYYLTVISSAENTREAWVDSDAAIAAQTAPGVTMGPTYVGFPADGPYVGQQSSPTGFRDATQSHRAGLRVTGDPFGDFGGDPVTTAAPEPPTYALIAGFVLVTLMALHLRATPNSLRF
jgi:hypothetical protein